MDYKPVPDNGIDPVKLILNLPDTPYNYTNLDWPSHFLTGEGAVMHTDNNTSANLITDAGATLGRVLFYDRNLSLNRSTACGSCHRPEKSYADSSPFSHGLYGTPTRRNSMTLINTRFYKRGSFFYDERASTLEQQTIMPILDHTEMNLTEAQIITRVQENSFFYSTLFSKAFGSSTITIKHIEQALAQFIRSMVSYKSKYDTGRAQVASMKDPFPNFTAQENRGKDLFLKPFNEGGVNCYACHTTEAFVSPDSGPVNNGVYAVSPVTDLGAYETYGTENFRGAYKIPTLRNIALTGPYMHNAKFTNLEQVVEHYNTGVQNHSNLSPLLKGNNGLPRKLNLSPDDVTALVRFLQTLTDVTIQSDPRWFDPFINQHL
jgi:cytochrome c peroxidase